MHKRAGGLPDPRFLRVQWETNLPETALGNVHIDVLEIDNLKTLNCSKWGIVSAVSGYFLELICRKFLSRPK